MAIRYGMSTARLLPRPHRAYQTAQAAGVEIHDIGLGRPINKYALFQRWRQEEHYGRLVAQDCTAFNPDVVLSGNTPLSSQRQLLKTCRKRGIRFVFWVQDFLGIAARLILSRKSRVVGLIVGGYFTRLEARLLRKSDAVVAIADCFMETLRSMGVDMDQISVIENWACLEELPARTKNNDWAMRNGLTSGICFLYSGTLSMKHNPDMLLQLAVQMRDRDNVHVVVVSHGRGADRLRKQKDLLSLDRLLVLPYQNKEELADVYATADVLVAVLDEVAGTFSVPSKVAAYLCAERPLLLAVPPDNLAARMVSDNGAGIVVAPSDQAGFLDAAESLLADSDMRTRLGRSARAFAENTFAIEPITDRFESILTGGNAEG